jgi:hypothetical protein
MEAKHPTRRHLLGLGAAAAGAAAVTAAEGLTSAAHGADGDPVLLAANNQANNPTVIEIVDSGNPGLIVRSRADDGSVVGENSATDGYGVRATGAYIGVNAVGNEIAVYAVSDYGTGVRALTYDGTAVEASTAVDAGLALSVSGAVHLSRSGIAVVDTGKRSVTVAAGVRGTSAVLATLQSRQAGVAIEAAVSDPPSRTFTIWLSRATKSPLRVAWMLLD